MVREEATDRSEYLEGKISREESKVTSLGYRMKSEATHFTQRLLQENKGLGMRVEDRTMMDSLLDVLSA